LQEYIIINIPSQMNKLSKIFKVSSIYYMRLLVQVSDVIRKKHYSIRTEQAYIEWIKRFASFHQRYPKYLTEKEIKGKREICRVWRHMGIQSSATACCSWKMGKRSSTQTIDR